MDTDSFPNKSMLPRLRQEPGPVHVAETYHERAETLLQ